MFNFKETIFLLLNYIFIINSFSLFFFGANWFRKHSMVLLMTLIKTTLALITVISLEPFLSAGQIKGAYFLVVTTFLH